ncbi:hypothetical protein CR513_20160, partial [Mucuna pruriens]
MKLPSEGAKYCNSLHPSSYFSQYADVCLACSNRLVLGKKEKKKEAPLLLRALLQRAIMATMNAILENLPVFNGKGYEDWCVKMGTILGFQELDETVKDGFQEPSKNASAE